jgi:hypothetical protein
MRIRNPDFSVSGLDASKEENVTIFHFWRTAEMNNFPKSYFAYANISVLSIKRRMFAIFIVPTGTIRVTNKQRNFSYRQLQRFANNLTLSLKLGIELQVFCYVVIVNFTVKSREILVG